jgi:DNA-binding response OmpR family regulator
VKLLLVEGEERVASFLVKGLRAHGYSVEWVGTGRQALQRVTEADVALVILDLGLPDLDGLEVLQSLRERGASIPVLILSARGRVEDRIQGLNLGADDYLVKPFAFAELLARIRANLRPNNAIPGGLLRAGSIRVDVLRREVMVDGRTLSLSAREFSLLKAFVAHPRQVLSRQELLSLAWDMNSDPGTNLVDVYVRYLRRKLGGDLIETVRGTGYRLRIDLRPGPGVRPPSSAAGPGTSNLAPARPARASGCGRDTSPATSNRYPAPRTVCMTRPPSLRRR